MGALLTGSILAVLALAFVLAPLLKGAQYSAKVGSGDTGEAPEGSAIDVLREIEFDQATGKLSDEDYRTLRASYTPLALAELKAREGVTEMDAAELLIARARKRSQSCPSCGPRPESDALFCSDCGRHLGGVCMHCGAAVTSDSARFCTECGGSLAA